MRYSLLLLACVALPSRALAGPLTFDATLGKAMTVAVILAGLIRSCSAPAPGRR